MTRKLLPVGVITYVNELGQKNAISFRGSSQFKRIMRDLMQSNINGVHIEHEGSLPEIQGISVVQLSDEEGRGPSVRVNKPQLEEKARKKLEQIKTVREHIEETQSIEGFLSDFFGEHIGTLKSNRQERQEPVKVEFPEFRHFENELIQAEVKEKRKREIKAQYIQDLINRYSESNLPDATKHQRILQLSEQKKRLLK